MASFKFYVTYIFSRNLLFRVYGIFPPVLPLTRGKLSHIIHTPFKKCFVFFTYTFHSYTYVVHISHIRNYETRYFATFSPRLTMSSFLRELIFCTDKLNIPFLVFHLSQNLFAKHSVNFHNYIIIIWTE